MDGSASDKNGAELNLKNEPVFKNEVMEMNGAMATRQTAPSTVFMSFAIVSFVFYSFRSIGKKSAAASRRYNFLD